MLPFAESDNMPFVDANPAVLIPLLLDKLTLPVVPDTARVDPAVKELFVMVLLAALLKTMASATVPSAPTAPVPPFKLTVAPLTLPADCVIVPALVAVSVTAVGPLTFPPKVIVPFPPDVDRTLVDAVEVTAPVVVIFPAVDSDNEPAVADSPAVERF